MKVTRKLVYLLMAMVVFSAPLAACTLPGFTMSEQEKECCHHMADHCGKAQMEESHSCCTKTPTLTAGVAQPSIKFSPLPVAWLSDAPPGELIHLAGFSPAAIDVTNDCKSPPGQLSVLRI